MPSSADSKLSNSSEKQKGPLATLIDCNHAHEGAPKITEKVSSGLSSIPATRRAHNPIDPSHFVDANYRSITAEYHEVSTLL